MAFMAVKIGCKPFVAAPLRPSWAFLGRKSILALPNVYDFVETVSINIPDKHFSFQASIFASSNYYAAVSGLALHSSPLVVHYYTLLSERTIVVFSPSFSLRWLRVFFVSASFSRGWFSRLNPFQNQSTSSQASAYTNFAT